MRNNEIVPFNFGDNLVRVVKDENGEPLWVAKDICNILGYSDAEIMCRRLDEDEKTNLKEILKTVTGINHKKIGLRYDSILITESGLYASILWSQKEEAKPFRKWLTSEVLPTIRKTGTYSLDDSCSQCNKINPYTVEFGELILNNLGKSAFKKFYLNISGQNIPARLLKKSNPYENDKTFLLLKEKINNKDIEFFNLLLTKLILGIENQQGTLALENRLLNFKNKELKSFFLKELNQGVFTNETLKWFTNIYDIESIGNLKQYGIYWGNLFFKSMKFTMKINNKQIGIRLKLTQFNSLATSPIYLKDMVCSFKIGTKATLKIEPK